MRETQQRTHTFAERYRRFAENEARGSSPLYEHLALHVSGCDDILDFLMSLPVERRQPNLLLAAVRHAVRVPRDGDEHRARYARPDDADQRARRYRDRAPGSAACRAGRSAAGPAAALARGPARREARDLSHRGAGLHRFSIRARRFSDLVRDTGAVWISNEMPGTFPRMATKAPRRDGTTRFLLAVNGEPVAWTGPHGQSIEWFAD